MIRLLIVESISQSYFIARKVARFVLPDKYHRSIGEIEGVHSVARVRFLVPLVHGVDGIHLREFVL